VYSCSSSHCCSKAPAELRSRQHDAPGLRGFNVSAPLVFISPFGETGPQADDPATDLTLFFASGIARLLTGQVDDLAEPPIRPVGEQSAFISGIAAACAGMRAAQAGEPGAVVEGSIQAAGNAGIGQTDQRWPRRQKPVAQAPDGRQRSDSLYPAGAQ
jgi:hypothetical protein